MNRPRLARWLLVVTLAACTLIGLTATTIAAHASLSSSSPAAGSVVDAAPGEIVLHFTEPVDLTTDAVRLIDSTNATVALGTVDQSQGSSSIVAAIPQALADGTYLVAWSAVSADSHPIRGAFTFSVGAPSGGGARFDTAAAGNAQTPAIGRVLGVGRFASYAGSAVLIGTVLIAAWIAPAALRRQRMANLLMIAGLVGLAGTALMVSAQAHTLAGSMLRWNAVADTRSGRWWLIRLALIAVLTIGIAWRRLLQRRAILAPFVLIGVLLFAVTAAGGHGIAGRAIWLGYLATVIHLAAMAVWLGGILLIAAIVSPEQRRDVAARFSPIALGAVATLAVTGVINAWRQLRRWSAITDSTYGRWLIAKLVVVVLVVGVAFLARRFVRRATGGGGLHRAVTAELVGLVVIVVATAGLTGASPPQPAAAAPGAPAAAVAGPLSATNTQGDKMVEVELERAVTGGTVMHIYVSSLSGSLQAASEIDAEASLPAEQLGPLKFTTLPSGPNHVVVNNADFPVPGRWTVTIPVRYGEFDEVRFEVSFDIARP